MKKIVFIFVFLFAISFQINAQWVSQIIDTTNMIRDIFFIDSTTGMAVGTNGMILRTTDGGTNWIFQTSGITNDLSFISFVDINYGWVVSWDGTILKTTDGGLNWNLLPNIINNVFLKGVCFADTSFGIIIGETNGVGFIFRTRDGGINWTQKNLGNLNIRGVDFLDPNFGMVVGAVFPTAEGWIYITTDGGNTWNSRHVNNQFLYSIDVIDENYAIAAGGVGWFYHTTDGGLTWIAKHSGYIMEPYDVCFTDTSNGTAIGSPSMGEIEASIIRTTNGGINWVRQSSGTEYDLLRVSFTDINNGWIVGSGGSVLHTTNGGVTFIEDEEQNFAQPKDFFLQQNYPNPFNPSTSIQYAINSRQFVTLKVYDVLGKEIATLVNEEKSAGSYEIDFNASHLASGIYYYQLRAGDYGETKKMILLK